MNLLARRWIVTLALVTLAAASPLRSQEPDMVPAATPQSRAVDFDRTCGVAADAGGVVAFGRDYLVRFADQTVEFAPLLGDRAPASMPLRWTLQDIHRGTDVVAVPRHGVTPKVEGDAVLWRRGSVHERYDLGVTALKQSFVFHERLAGTGDLVVTCAVQTDLVPQRQADGELQFLARDAAGAEFGRVVIGAVVGIDASGRRVTGELRTCGACTLADPVALEFVPQSAGLATRGFAVPCDPAYIGVVLETQWLSFGTSSTSCPAAPGLAASSRMRHVLWD